MLLRSRPGGASTVRRSGALRTGLVQKLVEMLDAGCRACGDGAVEAQCHQAPALVDERLGELGHADERVAGNEHRLDEAFGRAIGSHDVDLLRHRPHARSCFEQRFARRGRALSGSAGHARGGKCGHSFGDPAFSRVSDLQVRFLPYGELEKHRDAITRFGTGIEGIQAISRVL